MPTEPGHNPVEPDTPNQQGPLHHPHKQDHPGKDDKDDELPEDEEDTDSDPWWMNRAGDARPMAAIFSLNCI